MAKLYPISPENIDDDFIVKLTELFSVAHMDLFQLRVKNREFARNFLPKILKICHDNGVKLIINDYLDLALEFADGVHLGIDEDHFGVERQNFPKNFLVGVSCYDDVDRAIKLARFGVNYVSFGAFFKTETKKSIGKPDPSIIKLAKSEVRQDIIAIGGINPDNCAVLLDADYISVISYLWNGKEDIRTKLKRFASNGVKIKWR